MSQKYIAMFLSFLIISLSVLPSYVYAQEITSGTTIPITVPPKGTPIGASSSVAATSATCANGQTLNVPTGVSIYTEQADGMKPTGHKTIAGTATINDNPKDASISGDTSGAKRTWCFSNRWDAPSGIFLPGWVNQYDLQKTTAPVQTVPGSTTSGPCISGTTGVVATDVQLAAQEIALVVVSGTVTSTYSSCRDGNSRQHHALDIKANPGSAVKSPIVGTVVSSGDCGDLGYCTKINGEYGVWTFGHLQSGSGLQPNTPVQIGTQIGIIGATTSEESSTGPHVHIGIYDYRYPNNPPDPAIEIKRIYAALNGLPPPTFYPSGAPLVAGVQQTFQITDAIIITDDDKTKSGNQVCVGKNVKLQITVAGHQVGQNLQIGVQQNNEQLLTFTCRPGFNSPTCIYEGGIQSKINEDLTPTTNMISIVPQYGNSFDLTQPKQLTYEAYTDPSCSPYHAYIQLKNPHKPEEDLNRATLTLQNGQCSPSVNERNEREFNTWYCTSSYQSATVTIEVPDVNPSTPAPSSTPSRTFSITTSPDTIAPSEASVAGTAPAPETPAGQTTTEQASTCTDSDGGKEPNEKGTVTVGELTKLELSDICEGSILKEYYCNSDGTHNSEFINCPNGCKDDGACATGTNSVGASTGQVVATYSPTGTTVPGRRLTPSVTFSPRSVARELLQPQPVPVPTNFARYSTCEPCTQDGYKWCSQASRPMSSSGTCRPSTDRCAPNEAEFYDPNPADDKPVKCPATIAQEIVDNTEKSKDECKAAVEGGFVWCKNKDGTGSTRQYNANDNLNTVCGGAQPILNTDACSKTDDIIENIVWNELIAFATRYAASRSTPKFIQPPNDWEPTDGIEIPAAITKKRGTHVCEDISAAKINGELDKTNALSSEGSTPLFQAGDPISIKGNVEKYSSTCNGLNLECRDHQILGCKVSDKLFYISLEQQKCSGEYPDTIYKEMEHEKIWDWGFIATVVAGAVLPFFLTDVDTGVSPSGQPGSANYPNAYSAARSYDPYAYQYQYRTFGSQAGSGTNLVGIVNSLRGSNNYGSQKEWIMRTGIGIVTSIFSKPDATKERCFTVCGKTYQTKDPSRDTCASYTPPRTTTGTQVKRDAAIPGPKITLSYKEIKYDEEFGCAKNTACGAFANARVDVSLITPSGAVAPLDDTRTDSLGNYDVSFNAPSVDGTFNTVLKVKGVPPVQSATNTQTTGTRDVSASQLGGRT